MEKSESIKELATALAAAKSEMGAAKKSATNPHFRSKYADLSEIINVLSEVIGKHGLSYMQCPVESGEAMSLETIVMHTSGEYVLAKMPVNATAKKTGYAITAQDFGSALTYAKRYALAAMFGVATEDDDGNAASKQQKQPLSQPAPQKKAAPVVRPITQDELSKLQDKIDYLIEQEKMDAAKFLLWVNSKCGVRAIENMTNEHFKMAMDALAKKEG